MKIFRSLLFILLSFPVLSWCQLDNIRFKQLDISSGVSLNSTSAIFKDNRGFMWFGTANGLVRFDGYQYEIFLSDINDSTSISSNLVQCITQENDSTIWVGTESGLNRFDLKSEKFTRYFNNPFQNSVSCDYISDLLIDKEKNVWIGTSCGLNVFNCKTKQIYSFKKDDLPSGVELSFIQKLTSDSQGNIYFLGSNGYLCQYLINEKKFKRIARFETKLPFLKTEQLFCAKNDVLWIAFGQNVHLYDIRTNTLSLLQHEGLDFESAIDAINADSEGNIWLGSTDKGLFIFNSNGTRLLSTIKQDRSNDFTPFLGNGIKRIYCDQSGMIWIATIDGGISYYHNGMFLFDTYRHDIFDEKSIVDNRVNCILQASDSSIFVGTEKGVDIFNKNNGSFQHINAIGENPVLNLFEDSKKEIWVTTYSGNIFHSKINDLKKGIVKNSFTITKSINSMVEASNGSLWLGTMGAGVYILEGGENPISFEQYTGHPLSNKYVNKLFIDRQNNIWIGTTYGLCRFSPDKTFKEYTNVDNTKLFYVYSIFQDSKDRLWVGFDNGLLLFDQKKDDFLFFNKKNGLENEKIYGISDDFQGNLWLLSSNNLMRVNLTGSNEKLLTVKSYYENDGLPSNLFKQNSICRLNSNEILVGSMNGLGRVNPASVNFSKKPPGVSLTQLRVFNNEIHTGENYNGRVLLNYSISETKSIRFSHRENVFSFEFSALYYNNPQKCTYKYRLQGFHDNWIETKADMRIATFTNINPGKYNFEVSASDDGENWGAVTNLEVIVLPPFWLSSLAKIAYLLLLIISIFLLRYFIRKSERKRFIIRQEKAEAQRLHNLDNIKINLFTNISHEIRTPLTLIISPLEKLLSENNNKELEKPLNTMHRNSQRLLHQINQLLDFRKLETIGLDFHPSTGDIISFTRNIAMSFNDLAEGKGIRYIINSNIKELIMPFDHDKYDKIIYNLLSNAFKFTHQEGSIALEINFTEELNLFNTNDKKPEIKRGELIVKVKDTGIGIPEKYQSTIFERFVQANALEGSFENGSGIGLSLVYEYAKIHSGTIQVESEEGKGSCFTLRLPVLKYEPNIEASNQDDKKFFEVLASSDSVDPEIDPEIKDVPAILLVEDNEELRFYLKDNLKKRFRVYEASNGETGFSMAIEKLPDIIISDVLMPVMDGIALCQKLKNNEATSHIPVAILTALNTDKNIIEGIEAGADDYIVKPFNFKVLEVRINKLLQNQQKRQQQVINRITVSPSEIAITPLDDKFIKKAFELVELNMANPEFTVEEFSKSMAMSRMLLYKKLLSLTGKAPHDFIRTMRLKRAAQLLEKSQLNVSEVSIYVGFNDAKYFSQCFKKEFNVLPSEYQSKNEKKRFFKFDENLNKH